MTLQWYEVKSVTVEQYSTDSNDNLASKSGLKMVVLSKDIKMERLVTWTDPVRPPILQLPVNFYVYAQQNYNRQILKLLLF